jgi:hypothetical protein
MQAGGFMKLRILFPFVLLFAFSCASTSQYAIKPNPHVENPTQSRIIMDRTGSYGSIEALVIKDNYNTIGKLGYNNKLMWDRNPGLLKLSGSISWAYFGPYEFNVKPGHIYYIKARGGFGSISFELEKVVATKFAGADSGQANSIKAVSENKKHSQPKSTASSTNSTFTTMTYGSNESKQHQAIVDVKIKGIDDGIKTTKQQDYREAILFAKREAIERAGVKIKSITSINELMVESDYIELKAEAVLLPGYEIIDIGYQTDNTYLIILTGKVKTE